MTKNPHIERALAGTTCEALSKEVGVSPGAVSHWLNGRRQVKPKHVLALERATNGRVTRQQLRPDIYGTTES